MGAILKNARRLGASESPCVRPPLSAHEPPSPPPKKRALLHAEPRRHIPRHLQRPLSRSRCLCFSSSPGEHASHGQHASSVAKGPASRWSYGSYGKEPPLGGQVGKSFMSSWPVGGDGNVPAAEGQGGAGRAGRE